MTFAVQIENFTRSYGDVQAAKELTFSVREGELFGLIGPDGAGKTTTMRALCGLITRDSGTMSIFGIDPEGYPRKVRELIGYMPQRFSLYPDLTVAENLRFFADLYLVPTDERQRREERLMRFSRLGPFRDRRALQLSGGMKQKLALSCTLIHTPRLLILDEPTTGVDPVSRREFWSILKELSAEGISIVVSTPYMDEALLCDRTALMHKGKTLVVGTPSQITELYPHILIEATAENLQDIRQKLIASGIDSNHLHRFGGRLHIACNNPGEAERVSTLVREAGGQASRASPSIEDTFVAIVGKLDDENRAVGRTTVRPTDDQMASLP